MKLTWEKVFGVIGVCADGVTVLGGLFIWTITYLIGSDFILFFDLAFLDHVFYIILYVILFFVAISLICLILGLVGLKKLKKKPRLSGYLFLIAAVISGLISIFLLLNTTFILPQSIAYLIAGILCLRNKPEIEFEIKDEEI